MTTTIRQNDVLKFLEDYASFLKSYPNHATYEVDGYFQLGSYLLSLWSDSSLTKEQRGSLKRAIERFLDHVDVKIEVV